MPDSEDAVRHTKAALSVDAAFAAEGLPNPPSGLASLVADYVNRSTRDIPASKIANMAPGSGNLGAAATAGVNVVLGSLTPDQRAVMRAGGNPLNPADMAAMGAKLGLAAYALQASGNGPRVTNGGRYAGMKEGVGDGTASSQQIAALGRMSGSDFASRLGFTGEMAKEFGHLFEGTSGAFRSTAEDYKRIMGDPSATPEQRAAAAKRMEQAAKTKKEKEAARKFQEALEIDRAFKADAKRGDKETSGQPQEKLEKTIVADVAAAVAKAKAKADPKKPKPAVISSTL
jgi:hypothetical protein